MLIESSDRQTGNIRERGWINKDWEPIFNYIYQVESIVKILRTVDNNILIIVQYVSYIKLLKTNYCVISDFTYTKSVLLLLLFRVKLTPLELYYYTRGEIIPTAG